jgi:Fe-S-cluster containining protein
MARRTGTDVTDLDAVPRSACACEDCQRGCAYKPGWFRPGEPEKAAELLGVSLAELFRTRLAVDWWEGHPDVVGENVYVIAPALVGEEPGEMYPGDPSGRCVFFKKGRCEIHAAKPFECAVLAHGDSGGSGGVIYKRHKAVAGEWIAYQEQVIELLDHEPVPVEYEPIVVGDTVTYRPRWWTDA